jgi:hypothetical protein
MTDKAAPLNAPGTAFEAGRVVPTNEFDDPFGEVDARAAAIAATKEAFAVVLEFTTASTRPDTAGRRILALAWVLGKLPEVKRQKDLAKLLGCSAPFANRLIFEAQSALRSSRRKAKAG